MLAITVLVIEYTDTELWLKYIVWILIKLLPVLSLIKKEKGGRYYVYGEISPY